MNRENNALFQETEEKIVNAYGRLSKLKQLDRITVSDICREAEIHRTTFYNHFQDVEELGEAVQKAVFSEFIGMLSQDGKWDTREGIRAQIQYIYDMRQVIWRNLKSSPRFYFDSSFFEMQLSERQTEAYKKRYHCEEDWEMEYHRAFFSSGTMEIIRRWILSDCVQSPDEIAGLLYKICMGSPEV